MRPGPFQGGVLLADTSAWRRSGAAPVRRDWGIALASGQIATCAVVMMELLYTTRDGPEFAALEHRLRLLRDVPITRAVTDTAIAGLRDLSHRRPLSHRIPVSDALIAAAATDVALAVLHYDHHYDRLAEVLPFESRWIAPAGSLS